MILKTLEFENQGGLAKSLEHTPSSPQVLMTLTLGPGDFCRGGRRARAVTKEGGIGRGEPGRESARMRGEGWSEGRGSEGRNEGSGDRTEVGGREWRRDWHPSRWHLPEGQPSVPTSFQG